jgi:two-component system sensor histidine kinase VanS
MLTRQILFEYCLTLFGFAIAFVAFVLLAWNISNHFIWQASNPLYIFLHWIKEYILLVAGIICLAAWAIITYYFISKPLRYLDEIVAASEQLADPSAAPIVLPTTLKNVQDELNLVREEAMKNALLAKEAEQRKNDLIVYLAHDLKTPLTSVIGYLTLLRDEPQISQDLRTRYTHIALDKAQRLEDLINEFFDITRFNLTTLTLEPEKTNLSRMLEQVTSEFIPILAEKNLQWHTQIAPDIEILCDPDKLARVFDNLIRNAVNYSYSGTDITLSLKQLENQVEIIVQNHGKTISPDKLDRIFEQFFRLDSSRSSSTGGAGLGLAISKEIVELHGGSIKAESENESISFTVLLPSQRHKIV